MTSTTNNSLDTVVEEELTASERAEFDEQNAADTEEIDALLETIRGDLVFTKDMLKRGLLKDTVLALLPFSQASLENLVFTCMTVFGNMVGRKPVYSWGSTKTRANLWLLVGGETGVAAKTQGLDLILPLFDRVDPEYLRACKEKSIRTGAALLKMMSDDVRPLHDRRLLIVEQEWSKMLLNLSMRENPLAQDLIDMKDTGSAEKNVQAEGLSHEANEVHLSIVGNIQDDVLRNSGKAIQQLVDIGFMNRLLHVKTLQRTSSVDLPILDFESAKLKDLIKRWQKAERIAKDIEEITITPDAYRVWQRWSNVKSKGALTSIESNMNPNIRKLTARNGYLGTQLQVVLALLDGSDKIMVQHVKQSFDMMDFNNKSVVDIYSKLDSSRTQNVTQNISNRILRNFESSPEGKLTKTQLHQKNKDLRARQINTAIEEFIASEIIMFDPETARQNKLIAGNQKTECYILISKLEEKEKQEDLI